MDLDSAFTPLLTTSDWNEEWKEMQSKRRSPDSAEFWNNRAATFHKDDKPNEYTLGFIDKLPLQPGDTLLDMGCGNGALAIPLAEMGYNVIAADFSEKMLEALSELADRKGIANRIRTIHMSWSDDWTQHGISADCVDIAFASRSIATADLKDSLMRLHSVARRFAAATLTTSMSPRVDERILMELGLQAQMGRDLQYAFNILLSCGVHPQISYIRNDRHDHYASRDEALASLNRMRDDICSRFPERERSDLSARIDEWIAQDLVERAGDDGTFWQLSKPRRTEWAFLAWETDY